MEKNSIFLTDIHTSLGQNIAKYYREENYQVLATAPKENREALTSNESYTILNWHRGSIFSTHSVIEKLEKNIPEQFIIPLHTPPITTDLQHLSITTLQRSLNDFILGYSFLLREILLLLSNEELPPFSFPPAIIFVINESNTKNILEEVIKSSYTSLANHILESESLNFQTYGFKGTADNYSSTAEYIYKTVQQGNQKSTGKWLPLNEKWKIINKKR